MRRPIEGPGLHRGHVDVGVAGEGAAPIPLGATVHAVGQGPRRNSGVEHDGPAGQLVRRGGGRIETVHRRGVQVLEVGVGAQAAVGHGVAGGAGHGVVRAHAVAAIGVVVLGGGPGLGRGGVAGGALGAGVEAACLPVGGDLPSVAADVGAGQGGGGEGDAASGLGGVDGVHIDGGRSHRDGDAGIGVEIVSAGTGAAIGVAALAVEGGGQVQVLAVGTGLAGEGGASGSAHQAGGAFMAGLAGARAIAIGHRVPATVADIA